MKTENTLGMEYLSAVASERTAWRRLQDPATAPAQAAEAYRQWLAAAQRTTLLAQQLREAADGAAPPPHAALLAFGHAACRTA